MKWQVNTYIWIGSGLEKIELQDPMVTALKMPNFDRERLVKVERDFRLSPFAPPVQTVIFRAIGFGAAHVFRKSERRRHARAGTRGRRGARAIPQAVKFMASVFSATKDVAPQAKLAIDKIAHQSFHAPGMPGWSPAPHLANFPPLKAK